jgi:threonyl-tRNA synthetase
MDIEAIIPEARIEVDERSESVGKKIREASKTKAPYMAIVGDKELEAGTVSIRGRNDADLGNLTIFDFAQKLSLEIKEKN